MFESEAAMGIEAGMETKKQTSIDVLPCKNQALNTCK